MTTLKTFFAFLLFALLSQAQQQTVFKAKVFNLATATGTSGPMPNIGQAVHIVSAVFPTATTDLSDFVIRVEGSFDNTTYFPISEDITEATYTGSYAYVLNRCNGVYPFVRINYATASAEEVTINYTGSIQPIGQISLSNGRYIAASPLAGASQTGICLDVAGNCYIAGEKVVPVIPAQWTSVNLQTDTRTDGPGTITLYRENGNFNGWAMVCKSIGTEFDIIMTADGNRSVFGTDSVSPFGFILRESATGKLVTYQFFANGGSGYQYARGRWNSPTSENSLGGQTNFRSDSIVSFRITQGATTRSFSLADRGRTVWSKMTNFNQAEAKNDFFTTAADQVCFGHYGQNGNYSTFSSFIGFEVLP